MINMIARQAATSSVSMYLPPRFPGCRALRCFLYIVVSLKCIMGDVMGNTFGKTLIKVSLTLAAIAAVCVFVSSGRGAEDFNFGSGPLGGLRWRFIGPSRGGRSEAVVGDSQHPLVFYFGSAHGGVWKTTDAGVYWRNVSDDFF